MKKRKQQNEREQVLGSANGYTSGDGGGGLQKRKGNGFGNGNGEGGGDSPSTSSLPAAPSPNRLARFQSERASLPIWLARKQLLAEVTIEGHSRFSFLY